MNNKLLFPYESNIDSEIDYINAQNIYNHIVDEQSRKIWINRLLLSFTGDIRYARKLVLNTIAGKAFKSFLDAQEKIYIYGAGIRGTRLVQMFPEIKWKAYIDKYRVGKCNGLDIIKPENIKLSDEDVILISNQEDIVSIERFLAEQGVKEKQIFALNDWELKAQENQYFEKRCIAYFKDRTEREAFIDAGCYDGRDCLKFVESTIYQGNQVYAFEPDNVNYKVCKENLASYPNIEIFHSGLSDQQKEALFLAGKGEKARISNEGNSIICIDTIDHILEGISVGFIKMDIEGNERKALEGGRQHIEDNAPNMMISIYHKIEDIVEIPQLLLRMNPNYKFALGHYSLGIADTVLYVFE